MLYEIDNPDDINPQEPSLGWKSCPRCDGAHRPGTPCRAKQVEIVKPSPAPEQEQEGEQLTDEEIKSRFAQVADLALAKGKLELSVEKAEAMAKHMTPATDAHQFGKYTYTVEGGQLLLKIDRFFENAHVEFIASEPVQVVAPEKASKLERARQVAAEAFERMARKSEHPSNTDTEQADERADGELRYVPLPHVA